MQTKDLLIPLLCLMLASPQTSRVTRSVASIKSIFVPDFSSAEPLDYGAKVLKKALVQGNVKDDGGERTVLRGVTLSRTPEAAEAILEMRNSLGEPDIALRTVQRGNVSTTREETTNNYYSVLSLRDPKSGEKFLSVQGNGLDEDAAIKQAVKRLKNAFEGARR